MNKPDRLYKVLAESALRAVKLCSPFNVKVANNQEVLLKFDARNILFGTPLIEDKKLKLLKQKQVKRRRCSKYKICK